MAAKGAGQADLVQEPVLPDSELHRALVLEDNVVRFDGFVPVGKVIQDLRAYELALRVVKERSLALDGKVLGVKSVRLHRPLGRPRVVHREKRRAVARLDPHDAVGQTAEARSDEHPVGVKRLRNVKRHGRSREVLADEAERPEQLGLSLVLHRLRSPKAVRIALRVVRRQRHGDDLRHQVDQHRHTVKVRVLHRVGLVAEQVAEVHRVAQRICNFPKVLRYRRDRRQLDRQNDTWRLVIADQALHICVGPESPEEWVRGSTSDRRGGLDPNRWRDGLVHLGSKCEHARRDALLAVCDLEELGSAQRAAVLHAQLGRAVRELLHGKLDLHLLVAVELRHDGKVTLHHMDHRPLQQHDHAVSTVVIGAAINHPHGAVKRLKNALTVGGVVAVRRLAPGRGLVNIRHEGLAIKVGQQSLVEDLGSVLLIWIDHHAVDHEPEDRVRHADCRHVVQHEGQVPLDLCRDRIRVRCVVLEAFASVDNRK